MLQVDSGREWRGGQNQVRLLCRELMRQPEVEVRLFTKRRSQLATRVAADGGRVRGTTWILGTDPFAVQALLNEILIFKPDFLHAHDSHALWVCVRALNQVVGRLGSLLHPVVKLFDWRWRDLVPPRIVATRRVDFQVRRTGIRRLFGPSPWFKTDHVIAISDAVKRVLLNDGIPRGEVSVVHSGIDPDEVREAAARPLDIRSRLGLPAGTPLAVNVAALVGHKDQVTLIRAAAAARDLRPDLHWVIAGEGKLRGSLAAEIERLGLRERVHLVGYIDEADALIREGDVFVMSSKEEGLGSVVLNALALGKPIVATRGGGLPEMLPPEALVPVGDAAALAQKVVAALDHRTAAPFPPQFTAAAMAAGVLAVYRSLT